MDSPPLGGAINPYALAETLIGKRIDWNRIERPLELLERTLETPADRLFDGGKGSPVFALQDSILGDARKPSKRAKKTVPKAKTIGKRTARAAPAQLQLRPLKAELYARIRPELRQRLIDMIVPSVLPQLVGTEYPGATWTDPGDFFEEGTEFGDPIQGGVGDCWLIAAMASVSLSRPYAIVQRNRTTGAGPDDFVNMIEFADTPTTKKRFEVTEKVPVFNGSAWPLFARSAEPGEIWPCVYEKAFAKFRSGNLTDRPDIRVLHGGSCYHASAALVPGTTPRGWSTSGTSADDLWTELRKNCIATPSSNGPFMPLTGIHSGRAISPITAWTYGNAEDAPDTIAYDSTTGIVGWHCYSVLGWITRRLPVWVRGQPSRLERYIVLRNPWGVHEGVVDTLAGDWDSHEINWTRTTPLNTRGVFAMTIESFKRYYAGMGVAS
ncbi:hypothetical protein FQY83_03310 [Luteimonas marina]|uniref:Calpain catalytic domain-containing protein n=1 Tax=Luteimonas marina TaxID=488485 RepID=A0A5C5UBG8_9GAMM|nr:C2 family cysteine protease [Luteimonas marina]TWT23661.1 hypothetical protein FQY83_03310 [Luteimonas marina]